MDMTTAPAMADGAPGLRGESARQSLLRLLTWLSPSFPTGGFSYSHGLEYAVEEGLVAEWRSLAGWVSALVEHGAGRTDAVLFCTIHNAVATDDAGAFDRAAEIAAVMRGTRELALESTAQGAAFLTTLRAAWPDPAREAWADRIAASGREATHAVAVALAAAAAGIALAPALAAFLHAFAANIVSAGVRLVPLGQTDGQRALAALEPVVLRCAAAAPLIPLDDIGGRAPLADWTSLRHETQYTRLFRS
ncbi:urease accessory protein UreF [Arenibaculum pallidiluteum]|uniref:urease accessory protein UreF n=1 Tax=Arenibaculum pallidiluteum TaxID=2812559 RepID=UPI001F24BFE1|nr:urease accessory UreF family protein [Arenibaculum pallidiluteum]